MITARPVAGSGRSSSGCLVWRLLAARWLAAGCDSEPLRQLAELRRPDSRAVLELMPVALRSVGFDPPAAHAELVALPGRSATS